MSDFLSAIMQPLCWQRDLIGALSLLISFELVWEKTLHQLLKIMFGEVFERIEELAMVDAHVEDCLLPVDQHGVGAEHALGWKAAHFRPLRLFIPRLQIFLQEEPIVAEEVMALEIFFSGKYGFGIRPLAASANDAGHPVQLGHSSLSMVQQGWLSEFGRFEKVAQVKFLALKQALRLKHGLALVACLV